MIDKAKSILAASFVYALFALVCLIPLVFSSIAMYKVIEVQEAQGIILSNQREILKNQQIVHDIVDAIVEEQALRVNHK